ncbi:Isopenicillin N epimerase component 2 [Conoideocrella luteorostrata]|uniref:Isopenicillin N epimerase component 2 n=1 Tax=Conoideocrella luteorostrata TaxID=1105319 RepID=A0AAJ0CPE6_9HYPO|nr:Isopenicillin N epimerase component 2 [Conoideocrella luteorostrata]
MQLTSESMASTSPLSSLRVVELAGLAPGPFCGLLLADYGASVLRIDGPRSPKGDILARHKSSICLDLKQPSSKAILLSILSSADVLIDPYRPGVLERLGLSPSEVLLRHNPRLIVARLTGFRRDGKYQSMAGHDINYLAVSGVLSMLGRSHENPYPPANLLADFAGGGLLCFVGVLMAWISRSVTGKGQVVEANMVDGSAYLATFPRLASKTPFWASPRGENVLDGGCPWYTTYETKDKGKYFAVGALEPQFYLAFLRGLGLEAAGLPIRDEKCNWPTLRAIFAEKFKQKTREEWEAIFDNTDGCATPVLGQNELEKAGYEQRLPVHLAGTPGKPIPNSQGGWMGGTIDKGSGGAETLLQWMEWTKDVHYFEGSDGLLHAVPGAKL